MPYNTVRSLFAVLKQRKILDLEKLNSCGNGYSNRCYRTLRSLEPPRRRCSQVGLLIWGLRHGSTGDYVGRVTTYKRRTLCPWHFQKKGPTYTTRRRAHPSPKDHMSEVGNQIHILQVGNFDRIASVHGRRVRGERGRDGEGEVFSAAQREGCLQAAPASSVAPLHALQRCTAGVAF